MQGRADLGQLRRGIEAAAQRLGYPLGVRWAALPDHGDIDLLIETRRARNGGRQPAARHITPHVIDQDALDDRQHVTDEAAAAVVTAHAPKIILDQPEANVLVEVLPRRLVARESLGDTPADVGLEEALEGAPGRSRR